MMNKQKRLSTCDGFFCSGEIMKAREELLLWHSNYGRHCLPWRLNASPYAVLVSEFMLQQTTVATVIPRFHAWMNRFPTIHDMAMSNESEILSAWEGLGYYSRARRLLGSAKAIVTLHNGIIPRDLKSLEKLPGIGPYTAAAIAAFAYDEPAVVLDTNIIRVLCRVGNIKIPIDNAIGKKILQTFAANFFPSSGCRSVASALMDLGAMICTPTLPQCSTCPLQKTCKATKPETLPKKSPRPVIKKLFENRGVFRREGLLYLEQSLGPRWQGLWILPELGNTVPTGRAIARITYPITRYRITMKVFEGKGRVPTKLMGFNHAELSSLPMPSPMRKIIEKFLLKGDCSDVSLRS